MVIYVPITNRISGNFDRNILESTNLIYIIIIVFYHYILPMPCMYIMKIAYPIKLNEIGLNKTQTGKVIIRGKEWIIIQSFIKLIFLNKV
jgi:hypothetical protein